MPVTDFPHLAVLLFCKRSPFRIFDQFREVFNETNSTNLCRERRLAKSCHQVMLARKKHDQKERATDFQVSVSKSLKVSKISNFNFKIFECQ